MIRLISGCHECPYMRPSGSSFYCMFVKREVVIPSSMYPKWCPMEKEDIVLTVKIKEKSKGL